MKTPEFALVTVLGLALTGLAAYAQSEPADQPPPPPRGPFHRPPPLEQVVTNLLDKYDVNKDGVLDQTELAALRQDLADGKIGPPPGAPGMRPPGGPGVRPLPKDILDKYDLNKDGQLDESERAALEKDIQSGKIPPPPPPMGHRPPPSAAEIIEKFDVDKDGKLDEAELSAFLKDLAQHRPPPPGPHGPMWGPPPGGAPPGNGAPQQ
jgi:hypothetical protein